MVGKRAVGKTGVRVANLRPKEAWVASALGATGPLNVLQTSKSNSTGKREVHSISDFASQY